MKTFSLISALLLIALLSGVNAEFKPHPQKCRLRKSKSHCGKNDHSKALGNEHPIGGPSGLDRVINLSAPHPVHEVKAVAAAPIAKKSMDSLPLASTTHYNIGSSNTACGTSPSEVHKFGALAAVSENLWGKDQLWMGPVCGQCFMLYPVGDVEGGHLDISQVQPLKVTIKDVCPNDGNQQWCPKTFGPLNSAGVGAHFDIMRESLPSNSPWSRMNLKVRYEKVSC